MNLDWNLNEYPGEFQIYLIACMKNCLLYETMWFLYRVYEYESDYERKIVANMLGRQIKTCLPLPTKILSKLPTLYLIKDNIVVDVKSTATDEKI